MDFVILLVNSDRLRWSNPRQRKVDAKNSEILNLCVFFIIPYNRNKNIILVSCECYKMYGES